MNNTWSLTIIKIENGFICNASDGQSWVVEVNDIDEVKSSIDLLYSIADHFNLIGSRYDEKRLTISHCEGDKFNDG